MGRSNIIIFLEALMEIKAISAFSDNYIWTIIKNNKLIFVDTGQAQPVLDFIKDKEPIAILLTHKHDDHVGGVFEIKKKYPEYNWEIKNQYYMNIHSPNTEKYVSSTDAVSKFPEKCTAIAARLNDNQELEVFIPFGTNDLTNFRVSPTPHYFSDKDRQMIYNERVKKKNWNIFWPNISIEFIK